MSDIKNKLVNLEDLKEIYDRLGALISTLSTSCNTNFTNINSDISSITEDIADIKNDIDSISEDVDELTTNVETKLSSYTKITHTTHAQDVSGNYSQDDGTYYIPDKTWVCVGNLDCSYLQSMIAFITVRWDTNENGNRYCYASYEDIGELGESRSSFGESGTNTSPRKAIMNAHATKAVSGIQTYNSFTIGKASNVNANKMSVWVYQNSGSAIKCFFRFGRIICGEVQ